MESFNVYKDIKARTNGEMYIGVVGPVRTGKSTFIKRFMEQFVIPGIEAEADQTRARDELPQSAKGTTVMTTEPKFIPKDAVQIQIDDDIALKVRLIDCVGYMVEGATGHLENGQERMVKTPWFDYDIPFTKAAQIGTQKVIRDHSTIGIVVTTDGSFGDIQREGYLKAEQRTIEEMREQHKPFLILLNTTKPEAKETQELAQNMSESYQKRVIPMNVERMGKADIASLLKGLLLEFPISEIAFSMPKWVESLPMDSPMKLVLIETGKKILDNVNVMGDIYQCEFPESEYIDTIKIDAMKMDSGNIKICISVFDKYYYDMLSEMMGMTIENEYQFMQVIKNLAKQKREYEMIGDAIAAVKSKGYGAVTPAKSDIHLDKPEIIKHGNKFGVKIKAEAPSIHMIKANITTEIAPIVGSEEQAKDLIAYIENDTAEDESNIWNVNIFGKTIEQLVEDGMRNKTGKINEESQLKLQDTMEKIVNDSNGGLVCIII